METGNQIMITQSVKSNLRLVQQKIEQVCQRCSRLENPPRLVAVSKTYSADYIRSCYAEGQRHFGENYAQELIEKSEQLTETCPQIKWHFIGRLQSNKIRKLLEVENLWCVETLASEKHVNLMQKHLMELGRCLNIFVQINTSGEDNKGGLEPEKLDEFLQYLRDHCPNINPIGLMTIGSVKESSSTSEINNDFCRLVEAKNRINKLNPEFRELSMGMSSDFETAISYGSTNIRIGSVIFGALKYAQK